MVRIFPVKSLISVKPDENEPTDNKNEFPNRFRATRYYDRSVFGGAECVKGVPGKNSADCKCNYCSKVPMVIVSTGGESSICDQYNISMKNVPEFLDGGLLKPLEDESFLIYAQQSLETGKTQVGIFAALDVEDCMGGQNSVIKRHEQTTHSIEEMDTVYDEETRNFQKMYVDPVMIMYRQSKAVDRIVNHIMATETPRELLPTTSVSTSVSTPAEGSSSSGPPLMVVNNGDTDANTQANTSANVFLRRGEGVGGMFFGSAAAAAAASFSSSSAAVNGSCVEIASSVSSGGTTVETERSMAQGIAAAAAAIAADRGGEAPFEGAEDRSATSCLTETPPSGSSSAETSPSSSLPDSDGVLLCGAMSSSSGMKAPGLMLPPRPPSPSPSLVQQQQQQQQIRSRARSQSCARESAAPACRHFIWPVKSKKHAEIIQKAFGSVSSLYIADGHHRTAAACNNVGLPDLDGKNLVKPNRRRKISNSARFLTALIFPANQLNVLSYNRCLTTLGENITPQSFLSLVSQQFDATEVSFEELQARQQTAQEQEQLRAIAKLEREQSEQNEADAASDAVDAVDAVNDQQGVRQEMGLGLGMVRNRKNSSAAFLADLASAEDGDDGDVYGCSSEAVEAAQTKTVIEYSSRISMYLDNTWYELELKESIKKELHSNDSDPLSKIDAQILLDRVFNPVLSMEQQKIPVVESEPCSPVSHTPGGNVLKNSVIYVDGREGLDGLQERVDSGEAAVAFSVSRVSVEQIMDIADNDQLLPPKATFFDPKPASGLLLRLQR